MNFLSFSQHHLKLWALLPFPKCIARKDNNVHTSVGFDRIADCKNRHIKFINKNKRCINWFIRSTNKQITCIFMGIKTAHSLLCGLVKSNVILKNNNVHASCLLTYCRSINHLYNIPQHTFFISKYHVGEVCLIHAPKIVMKESLAPTHTCESFKSRMCVGDFTIQRDIRPPQIPFNSRVMHLFFSLSPASIHTFIMRCL